MSYDKKLITGKTKRWKSFLEHFYLPTWEQLPNMELYMDQVISLLNQYIGDLQTDGNSEERIITSNSINNYVRMQALPAPVKKKYNRVHLAYLIMICMMKQSLSIADIKAILPSDLSEEEVKLTYTDFAANFSQTARDLPVKSLNTLPDRIAHNEDVDSAVRGLIYSSAALSSLTRVLAVKLIELNDVDFSEEAVSIVNKE